MYGKSLPPSITGKDVPPNTKYCGARFFYILRWFFIERIGYVCFSSSFKFIENQQLMNDINESSTYVLLNS